jgi:hypothetical protein
MVQTTLEVKIMQRTSPLWKILSLCLIAHAGSALAQTKPADPPATPAQAADGKPKLEVIETIPAPRPTINATPKSARGGTKITEKKDGGRVTEVKVEAGGSHYTMKPNTPAGNAQVGDVQSGNSVRPPQWTVLEFGPGKKKTPEEAAAQTADAPPPKTVTPAK